jgi:PAS domain S-box-containing protein
VQLEKSSDFFQKIAKTMPGVLFVYDLVLRRNVYVNQGGWGVLGYTDEEVLEMGDTFLARIMHPEDLATLPKLAEQYARASEGEVLKHQFRMRHKNGEWRWVHRLVTVFNKTPDGRPQQLVGTATDVTDLKRAEKELQLLSSSLLDAQDQERRRIARELHDGTAQNIFAIRLNLSQLERQVSPAVVKTLSECQSLCDKSLQEIRTLSYLLHPPMLDQGGLIPAVRWFVEGFATRSSLNIKLEVPSEMERLPSAVERDLFLVVQEALTNAVRHSGSDRAVVRLDHQINEVVLQVQDFGQGMPDKATLGGVQSYRGVGIPSMRERLRHISGRLDIKSSNQGTTVIATVPLPSESSDSVYD